MRVLRYLSFGRGEESDTRGGVNGDTPLELAPAVPLGTVLPSVFHREFGLR